MGNWPQGFYFEGWIRTLLALNHKIYQLNSVAHDVHFWSFSGTLSKILPIFINFGDLESNDRIGIAVNWWCSTDSNEHKVNVIF